jgi:hypothetical protein
VRERVNCGKRKKDLDKEAKTEGRQCIIERETAGKESGAEDDSK